MRRSCRATDIATVAPSSPFHADPCTFVPLLQVRYIQIKHLINDTTPWKKVFVWGMDAYDQFGRWGPPPAPARQTRTLRELLGINGIWGWGFNAFSNSLVK